MKINKYIPLFLLGLVLTSCGVSNPNIPSTNGVDSSSQNAQEKFTVEWNIDSQFNVEIAGYSTLPTSVNEGTTLDVKVEVEDTNYCIDMVTCNDIKVISTSNIYKIAITRNSVIDVLARKDIKELQISKQPTDLTYNVDENFDPTGLEVKALYKDNSSEIIPLNSETQEGYYFYPIVFEGGEDKVQVYYKDKVADINLTSTVECFVSIDPNGGTISNEYISRLQALNLKNFAVSSTGVITFNHNSNLPEDILLPTEEEISKKGYSFTFWNVDTTIKKDSKGCTKAVANWELSLVEVRKVYMTLEESVPYLIIDGSYNSVDSVYLYLYEGSAKIEITGDTYTKTDSNDFQVKFDLRKLSNAGSKYHGRWMDIRFNTVINGVTESMQFNVVENPEIEVDLNQIIYTTTHNYHFATYNDYLKVYYKDGGYSYSISFESDAEHDYVIFNGITTTLFADATLQISWYVISIGEDVYRTTTINKDGSFSLKVDMDAFPHQKECYAHITILDKDSQVLFGGKTTNFLQSASTTTLAALQPSGSAIKNCVTYETSKATYYIGGNGTGLMHYSIAK